MLGSYLARLSTTFMRSVGGARVDPLSEVKIPLRIWPTDVDVYLHVNNGRYLTLMDFGRFVYSVRTGLLTTSVQRRWSPVLGAATVHFWRELRTFARVDLVTRVAGYDEKWIFFEHRFERRGRVHAIAAARAVFKHKGRTVRPSEVFAALGHEGPPPELPEFMKRWQQAEPPRPTVS